MLPRPPFQNFDEKTVYEESKSLAVSAKTHNFVVEFSKEEAQVAFNLGAQDIEKLLNEEKSEARPIRWINIWAPNQQTDIVKLLGSHYKFSPRLLAIVRSVPDPEPSERDQHMSKSFNAKPSHRDDVEAANSNNTSREPSPPRRAQRSTSHYALAKNMVSYQSIDVGGHFLCIGANWMHESYNGVKYDSIVETTRRLRLWSWLVLCDDHTVLTIHEDTGSIEDPEHLESLRGNTLSVLWQLSKYGHLNADPVAMQSARQGLDLDASQADAGTEGASNLFYYLFDDWRSVYVSIDLFRKELEKLRALILEDVSKKSSAANIQIIPRLHRLGLEIRVKLHLYEGYKNLIQRILEPKATGISSYTTPPITLKESQAQGVVLANSARQRFERLGDRIQLLILSEMQEFLAEKDALISTYFNITAQKDSEATARLTRSATLLARLSVLFLPTSLMTSYFSVNFVDLHYTVKTYWTVFAVLMSISFVVVMLLSKQLMWVTEAMELRVKIMAKACKNVVTSRNT